MFELEGF